MEVKNYFATDTQGNVLGSAQVYLYLAGTTTLASGLKNISGASLGNPFVSDVNGLVQFKAPDGEYDLRVVKPGREFTIRIQCFDGIAFSANLFNNPYSESKGLSLIPFKLKALGAAVRTTQEKLSDHISVKDFGATGDGVTDDSPAFQAAVEYICGANPGGINLQGHAALYLPPGQYLVKNKIRYVETTNRKINLRIQGAGSHQATIMVDKDNHDGFLEVGVSGGNEAIFQVSDFTIVANGENNGTAMRLFADPVGLSRNRRFIVQNISVRPNSTDGMWFNRGIVVNGMYYGLVDNCSVSGPFGGTVSSTPYQDTSPAYFMDVGYDLTDCYDPTIQNCFSWSSKVAYDMSNTIDPGSEGGMMFHSGASRVLTGLKRHTQGREPGFIVAYCHFNYRDSGIDLMNLKDVDIKTCMIYNENINQIGTGPAPVDIRTRGCQDVTINGCRHQFNGDPRRDAVSIDNSFGNTEGRQEHRALNFMVDGNDYATTAMRNLVSVYGVSDKSLGRIVLKSFQGNQWIDSAIGVTTENIIYMPNGGDPVGWNRVIDGFFGVFAQDGSRNFGVSPSGHVVYDKQPLFVPAERPMVAWRRKRSDVLQSLGMARILCIGDSTVIGVGAITATAPFPRRYSFPSVLARRLTDLNAIEAGPYGTGGFSGPNYGLSDPRVSIGSGWNYTVETLGGGLLENGGNANPIQFAPGFQWDTAEIWFASNAPASGNFGAVGSTTAFSLSGGSIEKRTFNMGSLTSANFMFQRSTGVVRVVGYVCYNSSKPGVIVHNAGRSGWRAEQGADNSAFYSPLSAAVAVAPDLTIVTFGLNEWNQGVAPSTFEASMSKIVDALTPICSVALMMSAQPTGTKAYPWSAYQAVIRKIAVAKGLPVCNVTSLLGPAPENTQWMRDSLHPTAQGYGETALLVEKMVRL